MTNSDVNDLDARMFDQFLNTGGGARCVEMLGSSMSLALLQLVYGLVLAELPNLEHDKKYLSKHLCNEVAWIELSRAEGICAGMFLAFLVRNNQLPLRMHTTPSGKGPKRYVM